MSFRRSQLSIAALFGGLGFQYSTWAARLPALTDRLHLSAGEVGVPLLAFGWRDRWGDKRVVPAGGILAGTGLARRC